MTFIVVALVVIFGAVIALTLVLGRRGIKQAAVHNDWIAEARAREQVRRGEADGLGERDSGTGGGPL